MAYSLKGNRNSSYIFLSTYAFLVLLRDKGIIQNKDKVYQNMKHLLLKKVGILLALFLFIQCPVVMPSTLGTIKSIPDSKIQTSTPKQILTDSIYDYTEAPAKFPGGEKEMYNYLSNHIKYPAESTARNEQGKVIIQFVISKSGEVMMPKVVKSVTPLLDNEALRVVSSMPAFIPAEHEGKNVASRLTLPIAFKLNNVSTDESNWRITDKTVVVIDGIIKPEIKAKMLNPTFVDNMIIKKPFPETEKLKLIQEYGSLAANGVVLITSKKLNRFRILPVDERIDADSVRDCLFERPCLYPGGENELHSFVNKTIKYPSVALENRVQGKVLVGFAVNKSGEISSLNVIESVYPALDNEALRVASLVSKSFIPGTYMGENIDMKYELPVNFVIVGPHNSTSLSEADDKPRKRKKIYNYSEILNAQNLEIQSSTFDARNINTKFNNELPYYPNDELGLYNSFKAHYIPVNDSCNVGRGQVVVSFVVDKKGKIKEPKVIKSQCHNLNAEVLRLISLLDNFNPGSFYGENVGVRINHMIEFQSDSTTKKLLLTPIIKDQSDEYINSGTHQTSNDKDTEKIYTMVEQQPQFSGGDFILMEFISHNLRYPAIDLKQRVQGRVIIQFVIDKSGKVRDPKIVRSVSPTTDAEALRVVNLLPDFIPGRQNGEPVSVTYTLPIVFSVAQ